MHRASTLARGDPSLRPPPRVFRPLKALIAPWHWRRLFDDRIRREARRHDCAFVHFGVECVIHLPEASYGVPWRDVRARRDGPSWRIEAAGIELSLADDPLADWERRRLLG